jgi:glutamate formiminotransferase
MDYVKDEARSFAQSLASLGSVPVFYYGSASSAGRQLRDIRYSLGYMEKPSDQSGIYIGKDTINMLMSKLDDAQPDISPSSHHSLHGVSCCGAVPYIRNLNIRFRPEDEKKHIMAVTKAVRIANLVQALTLSHQDGSYEVACNLLRPREITIEDVLRTAEMKATELGISIVDHYTTGLSEDELLSKFPEEDQEM